MDEITNVEQQTADQQDAFLSGWNDEQTVTEVEPAADRAEEAEAEETEEVQQAAEQTAEENAEHTSEAAPAEESKPAAEPSWLVKHMGEEKTVKASDVTPELLQKGLDYDRVRGKYDEAKPVMEMFSEFAKKANMSVSDYVKYIRTEAKKADGLTAEEAQRVIDMEDREAAVAAKEAAQQESEKQANSRAERIRADLNEFASAFPEIYKTAKEDPNAIPESVWKDVSSGKMSLTAAYAKYAVEKANAEAVAATKTAEAAKNNQKNSERSTGSMKSAGSDTKSKDDFLNAFNAG